MIPKRLGKGHALGGHFPSGFAREWAFMTPEFAMTPA
jgi:hypothetical protein